MIRSAVFAESGFQKIGIGAATWKSRPANSPVLDGNPCNVSDVYLIFVILYSARLYRIVVVSYVLHQRTNDIQWCFSMQTSGWRPLHSVVDQSLQSAAVVCLARCRLYTCDPSSSSPWVVYQLAWSSWPLPSRILGVSWVSGGLWHLQSCMDRDASRTCELMHAAAASAGWCRHELNGCRNCDC